MSQPQLPFDEELQRFRARTEDERGRYRALVLLGTGQTTTAALLIGALEPERVAILLTERTRSKGFVEEVAQKLSTSAAPWLVPDGNYETADAVYRGLKYVLDQWHASWPDLDRRTIAADVTGGFATMSVGLAKAAHVLRLTTIYVRSDYADIGGRPQPVPGTQQLEFPPDPYAVFGDLEAAEAQRLYAAHDYAGAERIFADLEQRVPGGGPDAHRYRAYALLARSYAAWEVFDWSQAQAALAALLKLPLPPDLEPHHARLQAQFAMLQRLGDDHDHGHLTAQHPPLSLLRDLDRVLPLLGTLHANARRRSAQGRYDVAAMFHYRCLELMSQHRLATHGILTEKPDFTAARRQHPSLEQGYRAVQQKQNRRRVYDLPDRPFGLFVGYMLLAALNDPLVQGYPIKNIEERTESRNKSMLAHGFRLISEKEYHEFRDVVHTMLERFFQVGGRDQPTWEAQAQFLNPFAQQEEPVHL